MVTQIVLLLLIAPLLAEGKPLLPSKKIRYLYYWMRRTGLFFVFISFSVMSRPLLVVYLIFRYAITERMAEAPILYLRSFQYTEGPTAFGKIIARVASRYGVLLAIVHESQPTLKLHAATRLTERADMRQVPDESWQEWIKTQMKRASLVIFDRTVDSQGLSWELDQAMSCVDLSKIILLIQQGGIVDNFPDVWKLEYKLGLEGEKQARKTLGRRIRTVILAA